MTPHFCFPNLVDDGVLTGSPTLTGGSWESTLPLTNLQDRRRRKVARSTDDANASTQFLRYFGSRRIVHAMGLFGHNLSRTGAFYRFRLYSTDAVTRADTATYFDEDGVVRSVANNILRQWHYVLAKDGTTYRTTLLERAHTNLVGTALTSWSDAGASVTGGQSDPAGGTDAVLIEDDDAGVAEARYLAVSFTGDGTKCIKIAVKRGTGVQFSFGLADITASGVWRHLVRGTFSGGDLTLETIDGSGTIYAPQPLDDGWWMCAISAPGVVAANDNRFYLYPGTTVASEVGAKYFWRPEAYDQVVPPASSLDLSEATTADSFTVALLDATPQEATYLFEGVAADLPNMGGVISPHPFTVGDSSGGAHLAVYFDRNNSRVYVDFRNDTASKEGYWTVSLALCDHIAVRIYQASDGAITAGLTINGGAEDTTMDVAVPTQALPSAWDNGTVRLAGRASGVHPSNFGVITFRAQSGAERSLAEMQALADPDIVDYSVYDSTWTDAYPAIYPAGAVLLGEDVGGETVTADQYADGKRLPVLDVLSVGMVAQYWSVEIDDTSNADGYVEIGRPFVGPAYVPSSADLLMSSAEFDLVDEATRDTLDGGAYVFYDRAQRKVWRFDLGIMDQVENRVEMYELKRRLGTTGQFLFVPSTTDTLVKYEQSMLCVLDTTTPAVILAAAAFVQPMSLLEDL